MKGVVLAGGRGTRLRPATRVVNKHVIPIYDRPMIHYPVKTLVGAGIDDVLVVCNPGHVEIFETLLEGEFQVDFEYRTQSEPKGIAHAVGLARDFVNDEFVVILGDNVLPSGVSPDRLELDGGLAKVFLTSVDEPSAYGVASVEANRVVDIEEKPTAPKSNYAVIGLYRYTDHVFTVIDDLDPSDRGEVEITDVNRCYVNEGMLDYDMIDGAWFDAGTPDGLFQAAKSVRNRRMERDQPERVQL